jgi:hypothetical protein
MWDDLSESTRSPLERSTPGQIKTANRMKHYLPSGGGGAFADESRSLTSKSIKTVRVDLLNDHRSNQRTSSACRRKQLMTEFEALKCSVEASYKSYRQKRKTDHLTARYLQWTSWFKKRYSTDPTTKLTRREFEKLWLWFGQLSNASSPHHQQQQLPSSKKKISKTNGIQINTIVDLFVEYGVFENHSSAMKLLKTIDTDQSQTITFLEFMDGINSSDITQTLQLRYFISSLVYERKILSHADNKDKNLLGAFSNAVLKTRLRRGSTAKAIQIQQMKEKQQQQEEQEEDSSSDVNERSERSRGGLESPSRAQVPLSPSIDSPASYATSRPHPLASRLRARLANPSRVYVASPS